LPSARRDGEQIFSSKARSFGKARSMGRKTVPVFPLDPTAEWEDLMNALEASVQYQLAHGGKYGPLFAFAPMTVPGDPDKWEPVTTRLQKSALRRGQFYLNLRFR
jgi:hypothetical protein